MKGPKEMLIESLTKSIRNNLSLSGMEVLSFFDKVERAPSLYIKDGQITPKLEQDLGTLLKQAGIPHTSKRTEEVLRQTRIDVGDIGAFIENRDIGALTSVNFNKVNDPVILVAAYSVLKEEQLTKPENRETPKAISSIKKRYEQVQELAGLLDTQPIEKVFKNYSLASIARKLEEMPKKAGVVVSVGSADIDTLLKSTRDIELASKIADVGKKLSKREESKGLIQSIIDGLSAFFESIANAITGREKNKDFKAMAEEFQSFKVKAEGMQPAQGEARKTSNKTREAVGKFSGAFIKAASATEIKSGRGAD